MQNAQKNKLAEDVMDFVLSGGMLYEAYGITSEELEALYTKGYQEYVAKQYEKAFSTFSYLAYLKTDEARYLVGLAATLHAMKKYEEAIKYYATAQHFDIDDPTITFHIAECFIALKRKKEALEALNILCLETKDQPQWAPLYEKAMAYTELLSKKPEVKK